MKQLYFVRHGESELNFKRIFAGQIDTPLTDKGRAQARAVGATAKDYDFDLIVSSPLIRALETAQIIAKAIGYPTEEIIVNGVFKEHDMGSLAGKSWDGYSEFENGFTDMESWDELLKRAKSGLDFLKSQPEDTILLVGHGAFARALATIIDPSRDYPEPPNALVVQLL